MEGKSLLFKRFGNVDCVPIVIDTEDTEEIIRTVKLLQKTLPALTWKIFPRLNAMKLKTA